jgi:hypothetical protein
MHTLALLALLATSAACRRAAPVAECPAGARDIVLSLEAIEPAIPPGTSPRFRLTLKNVSDHAFRILDAEKRTDLQHAYYRLAVAKDGKPVEVPTAISDPGPVSAADWLEVPAGETKTFVLASFPGRFETLPPGVYQASVDFWRDPFQSHATAYLSPPASFTVTK